MGLGLVTILVPLYLFLRSPRQSSTIDAQDDARIRSLLEAHPDSLGYFNTRQDKEIVWSETGKSGIAYRVVSGVVLASGDPLGDPEAWPGAIRAFLDLADSHGWTPGVLGCSELAGTIWVRETGFQALELGDEAIVDTRVFSLDGRTMRNVRQMVNRIRRQGYATEMMRVRDTPAPWREKALNDAEAWRVGNTERGFSMATSRVFDADRDPDAVVVVATKDGIIEGMLQFAPWGEDGMSLDLMRRNHAADPGINELLIVDALAKAPELGINRVSLNFAMFRSTFERGEKLGAGPVLKTWRKLLVLGNKWFQLESLYKFNAKFQPVWFPRFVIYPRVADFLRVSIAAGQAEAFIVFPRLTLPFRGGR
jgi:lysyl-tRNA synthetase class 2